MPSQPRPLSALLDALTKALELEKGLSAHRAVEIWPEVAGPDIAAHAWAHAVRGDTLEVRTDSPVWAHQLQLLEPQLVARMRSALGADSPVRHIRFKSGSRSREDADASRDRIAGTTRQQAAHGHRRRRDEGRAIAERATAARQAAEQVGDHELARALEKALRAQDRPE